MILAGTENVVSACQEQGVSRLVNTSTIDVVVGSKEIINGDENTPTPDDLLFPGYPITKYQAECMVLKANGMTTSSGMLLNCILLNDIMRGWILFQLAFALEGEEICSIYHNMRGIDNESFSK